MSLATRCTACGTLFRVVQDQLKVSEGWVRCGRCDEVFNAMEGLFDLERDAPPEWSAVPGERPQADDIRRPPPEGVRNTWDGPAFVSHEPAAATVEPEAALTGSAVDKAIESVDEPRFPANPDIDIDIETDTDTDHATPAWLAHLRERNEFPDAPFNTDLLHDGPMLDASENTPDMPAAALDVSADAHAEIHADAPAEVQADAQIDTPTPDFVTRAAQAQRWQQPRARLALASAALLLSVALAAQAMHHHRDLIAVRWPASRPALTTWCGWANCRIELPRRVDDITVESTSLTHGAAGSDAFKLSVTLRNRGAVPVALPSVDLSLTDAAGQLVARRALAPSDFRAASLALAAGSDATLQLMLSAGSGRVTGYTVEVFYP